MSCSRTQRSDAGEARTRGPSGLINKLGIVHCTYLGESGNNFKKILYFCLNIFFIFTNSADSGDPGSSLLVKVPVLGVSRIQRVNVTFAS